MFDEHTKYNDLEIWSRLSSTQIYKVKHAADLMQIKYP